jgi:hypothetical protein
MDVVNAVNVIEPPRGSGRKPTIRFDQEDHHALLR